MSQVKIGDLVDKVDIAVKFKTPVVEKFDVSGWGLHNGFTFASDTIILQRVRPYGPKKDAVEALVFDEKYKQTQSYIVPAGFLLDIAPPELKAELEKKYFIAMMQNLEGNLAYHGTIGADPEIFLEDNEERLIPAFDFLPSKEAAIKYGADTFEQLYWDGFQAEFTLRAEGCMNALTGNIRHALYDLLNAARVKFGKAKLSLKSVFEINRDLLTSSKPEHVAFGCMPSLNAYGLKGLEMDGRLVNFRTAGGHIHFGYAGFTPEKYKEIVKALDAILGVACVSLFAKYDTAKRRAMYGLAGEYRLPKHGLEYRPLSNAWLCHPYAANLVFDLARSAFMIGQKGFLSQWQGNEQETIEVINNCNVALAREILSRNKDLFVRILNARYHSIERAQMVYETIMNGIEHSVEKPEDIETNWNLQGYMAGGAHGGNVWTMHNKMLKAKEGKK